VSEPLPWPLRKHPMGHISTHLCCTMSCQNFLQNQKKHRKTKTNVNSRNGITYMHEMSISSYCSICIHPYWSLQWMKRNNLLGNRRGRLVHGPVAQRKGEVLIPGWSCMTQVYTIAYQMHLKCHDTTFLTYVDPFCVLFQLYS
jgi:hypothetical protein